MESARPLTHNTWENLLRLTSLHVSADQLSGILSDILNVPKLSELSESQAQELIKVLTPLPNLRPLIWEAIIGAVTKKQAVIEKPLTSIDATNLADAITPEILDHIAAMLIAKNVDLTLFDVPTD